MNKVSSIKKIILAVFLSCLNAMFFADGIYLWENKRNGERSCCLSLSGNDICNPQVPCTRNVATDLMGINDYITRLLGLEKSSSLSYATILTQAQYYIRHVLSSSITQLYYRYDECRNVKFFHEITETAKSTEKSAKTSTSTSSMSTTSGAKPDDRVFQHLVKLGLAKPFPKH